MPEPKRPLKVFLCYAHEDREAVRALYNHLVNCKVDAWLDEEKLLPGQDWDKEIHRAIRQSDVIIVVLSKKSITKEGYVQKEIRGAVDVAKEKPDGTIFVIPARLDYCNVPESLQHWHWVDLNATNSYGRLLMALTSRAEQIGAMLPISNEIKMSVSPLKRLPIGLSIFFILAAMLASMFIRSWPIFEYYLSVPTTTPTQTFVPLTTTPFLFLINTLEPTHTPTVTALPTEITDAKGEAMVLVPAGDFTMGSDNGKPDENPAQKIYLDAFYIDKYEVTNALYKICVRNSACVIPSDDNQWYAQARYADHPVMYVTWNMARAYCEWSDARLPTEAEWEKAARGTDGRTYPWGNTIIDCGYANYRGINGYCVGSAGNGSPVGSYENGKSSYGVYDLMGNAVEWVSSLYLDYPYRKTDGRENLEASGPRVIRGGSWNSRMNSVNSTIRAWNEPSEYRLDYGFRCAKDAP